METSIKATGKRTRKKANISSQGKMGLHLKERLRMTEKYKAILFIKD